MAISRMVDRVGLVLGGRYRLVALVGTGASASVYLADDVTLRRRVAVKILHESLAGDPSFLRRFRAEARAAAALNHPHVMAVYDWGQGEVPYLVTEYLGGGSLRAVLDLGDRLSPAQALLVGLEAARGLEYAHRRGFVHRDIKPANLLFDEDRRLRIADFGLARALAEAAWTEPLGAVLGTARYASPEQARGETLDGRSDVYSLSLVLIESLAGTVPFSADTPLGTLMGRVDKPVPVPDAVGPLAPVLAAAGVPVPGDRPDATEFAAMLVEVAGRLDRPDPLPLAPVHAPDPGAERDRDPTTEFVAERVVVAELEPEIMSAPPGTTTDGIRIVHEGEGQPETRVLDRSPTPSTPSTRRRRRRWPAVLTAVILVGALASGGWAYWYTQVRVPTAAVPAVVGVDVAAAEASLVANGWEVQRAEARADGTVPGQVLAQDPAPGTHLPEGDGRVVLTVSLGPTLVAIPVDVAGRPLEEVTAAYAELGLQVGPITEEFSEDVAAGSVLGLAPDLPAKLPRGSSVPMVVSRGPEPRTIPADVVGASRAEASGALEALGLVVAVEQVFDDDVPAGVVMAVRPGEGGQAARGSTVTLTVSRGPELVAVPGVRGRTAADAAQVLQAAGLVVTSTQGSPANSVTGTNPAAGTMVRPGTAVVIVTG